jgi:hypothetical protein
MPGLGAMDLANLVAHTCVELGFPRQLKQPWQTCPLDECSDGLRQGGGVAMAAKKAMTTVTAAATVGETMATTAAMAEEAMTAATVNGGTGNDYTSDDDHCGGSNCGCNGNSNSGSGGSDGNSNGGSGGGGGDGGDGDCNGSGNNGDNVASSGGKENGGDSNNDDDDNNNNDNKDENKNNNNDSGGISSSGGNRDNGGDSNGGGHRQQPTKRGSSPPPPPCTPPPLPPLVRQPLGCLPPVHLYFALAGHSIPSCCSALASTFASCPHNALPPSLVLLPHNLHLLLSQGTTSFQDTAASVSAGTLPPFCLLFASWLLQHLLLPQCNLLSS